MNNKKIGLDPMFRGFDATKNPNLFCIQVDDSSWSENNSLWHKDDQAVYSEDCSLVSVEEETNPINDITLAPNPASDYIEIQMTNHTLKGVVESVRVYDVLGNVVVSEFSSHPPTTSQEGDLYRLDISSLSPGVYFIKVGGKVSKFVKM